MRQCKVFVHDKETSDVVPGTLSPKLIRTQKN